MDPTTRLQSVIQERDLDEFLKTDFTAGQSFPCIALPRSGLLSQKNEYPIRVVQSLQLASPPLTTPSFSLLNKKKRRFRSTKPTKIDCEYLAGHLGRSPLRILNSTVKNEMLF